MEIRQYLLLLRKWAWALILGLVIGGAGAYFFSSRQTPIYQATTRVMVSSASTDQSSSYYTAYNDVQLAKTYSELIPSSRVLQLASEKLKFPISGGQVSVRQPTDSQILDVTVIDGDPQRAALIANSLVDVFIDYNETIQASRYISSENSLKDQIVLIEGQIANLQTDLSQADQQTQQTEKQQQLQDQQQRLEELKPQLDQTEQDIIQVEDEIAAFFPIPAPTATPPNRWSPTATSIPTPTLSPEQSVQLKEAQNRLDQLKTLRDLYKQTYASIMVLGTNSNTVNYNSRQDQLQNTMVLYQQIYSNLQSSLTAVQLARLQGTANVVQIEPASVPQAPIQPQPMRNGVLGAAVGLLVMGAIAFLIEYLDDTLKTPEDVDRYLHVPVIGLIGEMDKPKGKDKGFQVYVTENPLSPITEAFRSLRTNLDFAGVDKPLKTLLITSPGPSEGKSTLAVNLAAVMAQGEKKVVLLDSDLRRPAVHRYLQIANRRGLSELFRDHAKLTNIITPWGEPQIAVITSGGLPPNPSELVGSEKMERILGELKEVTDIVILDSPPCIVADPIVLSAKVDGVLLVIEPGSTKIGSAQVVVEQLNRAGARIVGVVLNPISNRRGHYYSKYRYYSTYYYYSRGYGYSYGHNGSSKPKRNGRPFGKSKDSEKKAQPVAKQPPAD